MFQNKEGQRVPEVVFHTRDNSGWKDVSTAQIFANKKVIVFSLPGAFTPTCSSSHVPRFQELAGIFKAHGVDAIACVSVNDGFVMHEWAKDQHADQITFLPDGNGEFTEKMGLLVDKSAIGFGKRSWRYSMLVDNGVITKMFIEPDVEGDPYTVSDADTMLTFLAPSAKLASDIVLFTKPNCGHCARAKAALTEKGLAYEEIPSTPRNLRAVSGKATTPQVFVDGKYIGGADELVAYLKTTG
jgi:glutaredoxin-like protein